MCRVRRRGLRLLSMLICPLLLAENALSAQGGGVAILVLEGNKAQNLISEQTHKPISVRVVDGAGRPVSGAEVIFVPPEFGPGGTFVTEQSPVAVTTNPQGVAEAPRFLANSTTGNFEIQVIASYMGNVSRLLVEQSNVTSVKKKSSGNKKLVIISAVIGGGVAAAFAAKGSGGSSTSSSPPTGATTAPTITFVNTTVGAPQ